MDLRAKLILGVLILALVFAAGRYSVKQTIVTEKEKIEDIKTSDIETDSHTVIVENPDGTKTTTIDLHVDTKTSEVVKETKELTVKENTRKSLNVSLLANYDSASKKPDFGLSLSKEIAGPVTLGVWGMKSGAIGLSIGINF